MDKRRALRHHICPVDVLLEAPQPQARQDLVIHDAAAAVPFHGLEDLLRSRLRLPSADGDGDGILAALRVLDVVHLLEVIPGETMLLQELEVGLPHLPLGVQGPKNPVRLTHGLQLFLPNLRHLRRPVPLGPAGGPQQPLLIVEQEVQRVRAQAQRLANRPGLHVARVSVERLARLPVRRVLDPRVFGPRHDLAVRLVIVRDWHPLYSKEDAVDG
mmetsp:Transcript_1468/g.4294  ORF Transcript_1468/g.4294 Transcript_1468/m.4294 type:complete len:215 (+) Transcript_1468:1006-1650(+)